MSYNIEELARKYGGQFIQPPQSRRKQTLKQPTKQPSKQLLSKKQIAMLPRPTVMPQQVLQRKLQQNKILGALPSERPSKLPTKLPSKIPTKVPSKIPTKLPSKLQQDKISKEVMIEGPVRLIEYKLPRLSKHIYLFGDEHVNMPKCTRSDINKLTVTDVIENAINANPDKMIDVFIEVYIAEKNNNNNEQRRNLYYFSPPRIGDHYLKQVTNKFESCLQLLKTRCPYPNVRFHYVDIRNLGFLQKWIDVFKLAERQMVDTHYIVGIPFDPMESDFSLKEISRMKLLPQNIIQQFKHELIEAIKDAMKYTPRTYEALLQDIRVKKQLDMINSKAVRETIIELFRPVMNRYLGEMSEFTKNINSKSLANIIHFAYDPGLVFPSSLMDMYTIGRMFRSFRQVPGQYSKEPQYIIVYAGNAHINTLDAILSRLPLSQEIQRGASKKPGQDYQCLVVKGDTIPLFKGAACPLEPPAFTEQINKK